MTYRTDKFAPGDKVTWADDHYANRIDGYSRKDHGDGPFVVTEVFERDSCFWSIMEHTQHLFVSVVAPHNIISGAFFKKVG